MTRALAMASTSALIVLPGHEKIFDLRARLQRGTRTGIW